GSSRRRQGRGLDRYEGQPQRTRRRPLESGRQDVDAIIRGQRALQPVHLLRGETRFPEYSQSPRVLGKARVAVAVIRETLCHVVRGLRQNQTSLITMKNGACPCTMTKSSSNF